jgi:hypothetical protein
MGKDWLRPRIDFKWRKSDESSGARKQETMYLDERDRNDYFRPSQSLFKQYCEDIATRYNLSNLVQKSEVRSITYDAAPTSSSSGIFTLQTSTGTKKARIVVLAIGAALKPTLPPDCPFCGLDVRGSVTHAFMKQSLTKSSIIPEQVLAKIQSKKQISCVVIGGGLTSAQVTALLIASGVTKVYHLMRGSMKVKPFDIDLPWIGKYKNFHLASFWSADEDQERWEMMRDARGGGSITPEYKAILNKLVKERKVELVERTNVVGAEWDDDSLKWRLKTNPLVEDMPTIDHVVYATGIAADFNSVPAVKQLMEDVPVEMVGGMPCLTNDLMWSEEMPFFVTGRLAGLRLGPGAANLEGARQGAERVAWKVGDLLMEWKGSLDEADSGYGNEQDGEVDSRRLGLGRKNQFEVLGLESD